MWPGRVSLRSKAPHTKPSTHRFFAYYGLAWDKVHLHAPGLSEEESSLFEHPTESSSSPRRAGQRNSMACYGSAGFHNPARHLALSHVLTITPLLISPNSLTLQSHPLHFEMLLNILNDSYVKTLHLDRSLYLGHLSCAPNRPLTEQPALVQSASVAELQLSSPHTIRLVPNILAFVTPLYIRLRCLSANPGQWPRIKISPRPFQHKTVHPNC